MKKHTTTQYWKSHGFITDPFSLGDNEKFFISPDWEEYLDLLPQFVRFCNTLLLVTGEKNVGKSALISQFTREKLNGTQSISINASECSGIEYLLELLHKNYGAPLAEDASISASTQLDKQLDYLKQNNQQRLLIIDDAEQLPLDMRQACLQIIQQQTPVSTCLPIILIGDTTLTAQFNALLTPTTAKECLHDIYINPLNLEQTSAYLKWCCLSTNGPRQNFPFSEEQIETLYTNSKGAIGSINAAAQQLLQQDSNETTFHWQQLLKGKTLWWMITIVIIIALLYLYQFINQPPELSKTFTKPLTMREGQQPKPNKDYQVANAIVKSQPAAATQVPVTQAQPVSQKPTMPTPAPQKLPVKTQHKEVHVVKMASKPAVRKNKTSSLFTSVMSERLILQKQRILKIDPKSYSLQLVAGQNLPAIQKFILNHRLQETALIAKVTKQSKTWYIVIYGVFPSAQAAKQGTKLLPPSLQAQKPWPRSYKSIQEMLKSANEK